MDDRKFLMCTAILTRNCNLRCGFCFKKRAGYSPKESISYADLERIVDFCCEGELEYIFLSGGEPLLYPCIRDALRYIKNKPHEMSTAIASNGILLNDLEACQSLVESGLDYIDISLKGKDESSWLKATGRCHLEEQMQAIKNLAALPIELTCSMVVTPANVSEVSDMVALACGQGAKTFSFTFVIDNEISENKGIEYLKANNPLMLIDRFLSQAGRLDLLTSDWWVEYSLPLCAYTQDQLSQLEGKLADPCQVHTDNCITIDANLNLLPCDMYLEDHKGKFGVDFNSWGEFVEYSESAKYNSPNNPLRIRPSDKCESCEHLRRCMGGCPVVWKNYSFDDLQDLKKSYFS